MELIRALLIEDEPSVREALTLFLDHSTEVRFDVIATDRLQAGLGILRGNGIDVVVLDLGLPDGLHLRAITEIRKVSSSVGILVLSGLITLADIKEAVQLGADGVRQKPPESPEQFARQIIEAKARRLAIVTALAEKNKEREDAVAALLKLSRPWWKRRSVWVNVGAVLGALAAIAKAFG
jgi:DNA-binding NarL/FixJ family response regulator